MTDNKSSVVEIKSLEKELQMLLAQYNDEQTNYLQVESSGQKNNQSSSNNLMDINNKIKDLLSRIQTKTSEMYPYGITNQSSVLMNNANLNKIASKLKVDGKKLQSSIDEYNSLEGENSVLKLQMNSHYYEYMFYIISGIIIGIYVLKVYTIPSENLSIYSIENVLLIIAIILLIYHSYNYLFNITSRIVDYTVEKTNNLYNLL